MRPLDAAIEYVKKNIPIILICPPDHENMPAHHIKNCKNPGKRPIQKGWPSRGIPTIEQVNEWKSAYPNANIGMPFGSISGFIGVDSDGEKGKQLLLEKSKGDIPKTWEFTTPGGGYRWIYRIPPGLTLKKFSIADRTNDHQELALLGEGQQTVLPPSVHANGGTYQWVEGRSPWDMDCAMVPSWIIKLMIRANESNPLNKLYEKCPKFAEDWTAQQENGIDEETWFLWISMLVAAGHEELAWKFSKSSHKHDERSDSRLEGLIDRQKDAQVPPVRCVTFGCDSERIQECFGTVNVNEDGEITNSPATHIRKKNMKRAYHRTDTGNAELFVDMHGDKLRYDHRRQTWFVWNAHRWAQDNDGKVLRMAFDISKYWWKKSSDEKLDPQEQKKIATWATNSESRARIISAISLAQHITPVSTSGDQWDQNKMLLGVKNGVIDLRTGELRPGRIEDNITKCCGTYYDLSAKAPRWEQFLYEIFAGDVELIDFIHRAVGYSLTGMISEEVFFLLHGNGRNGKSKFLSTINHTLGDYAMNTPFSTFELDNSSANTNDLAMLTGARFVTASETNESKALNEARIKMITGGDPVTARFLHREYFTYTPQYKIWLAMNHLPVIKGTDEGIWSRVICIPFNVSFLGREDRTLEKKLLAELPGILAWAVQGCLKWQAEGLNPPQAVIRAKKAYRAHSDPVHHFLEECTDGKGGEVKASELYRYFCAWYAENYGDTPPTQTAFGKRLIQHGIKKKRKRDGWYYVRPSHLQLADTGGV